MNPSNDIELQKNFAGLTSPYSDFATSKVLILPIPFDGTSEWHSGSRYGPKTIIEASELLELYDDEIGWEVYKIGIHTLPSIQAPNAKSEIVVDNIYNRTCELLKESKFIISLGGEHTISIGLIKAFSEYYKNLSVLHLDAHADLRNEYNGTKFGQATVIRRVLELCPVIQAGIRSLSQEEKDYIIANKLNPYFISEKGISNEHINEIVSALTENVYITLDLDVFDPSIMPAVGLPEPGGLFWNDILSLLKKVIDRKNVVGIDLVELCPSQGPASCAFLTAKLVYKIIGYQFS